MSACRVVARVAALLVAVCLTGVTTAEAVDLRGRIDTRNPLNGQYHPLANARVELVSQGRIVMRTLTGFDGFYYFQGARPGPHDIIVNGQVQFGTMIQQRPYQDIPPILVAPR